MCMSLLTLGVVYMLIDTLVVCNAHVVFGNLGLYVLIVGLSAFLAGLSVCGERLKLFSGVPDAQEATELGFVHERDVCGEAARQHEGDVERHFRNLSVDFDLMIQV
jgi:hypothetical protein